MIYHGQLGTMAVTNEIEAPVGMRTLQRILLVEGTRMFQSRRELLASYVEKEN